MVSHFHIIADIDGYGLVTDPDHYAFGKFPTVQHAFGAMREAEILVSSWLAAADPHSASHSNNGAE